MSNISDNKEDINHLSEKSSLLQYTLTPELVIAYRRCPRECWIRYFEYRDDDETENGKKLPDLSEETEFQPELDLPNHLGVALFISAELMATPDHILESRPALYSMPNGTLAITSNLHHLSREENLVYLALNSYILMMNGISCHQGIIINQIGIVSEVTDISKFSVNEALSLANGAYKTLHKSKPDTPKIASSCCDNCKMAERCLPDEYSILGEYENLTAKQKRMLFAPTNDSQAVFVTTQGSHIRLSGERIIITYKDDTETSKPIGEISQLVLMGNIQITSPCMIHLIKRGIPVIFTSEFGWYYGMLTGPQIGVKNSKALQQQIIWAKDPRASAAIARKMITAKINNQRTLIRNLLKGTDSYWKTRILSAMKELSQKCLASSNTGQIMGFEGEAAAIYFEALEAIIANYGNDLNMMGRTRKPPQDPVNSMLSFGYTLLLQDVLAATSAQGLNQWVGFLHTQRSGKPSLILDLMEEFRPTIVDSIVVQIVSHKLLKLSDFTFFHNEKNINECTFTKEGKKKFLLQYDRKMNSLITHPMFTYKVSWRKAIWIQVQILCKVLQGEIAEYQGLERR